MGQTRGGLGQLCDNVCLVAAVPIASGAGAEGMPVCLMVQAAASQTPAEHPWRELQQLS